MWITSGLEKDNDSEIYHENIRIFYDVTEEQSNTRTESDSKQMFYLENEEYINTNIFKICFFFLSQNKHNPK